MDNIMVILELWLILWKLMPIAPKLMVKVDIEKAYNTKEWKFILATLRKMKFPKIYLSWIKACLYTFSFSFLINGPPSKWIKAYRRTRQGNPVSLYLLMLVSQNVYGLMNYALHVNILPAFVC